MHLGRLKYTILHTKQYLLFPYLALGSPHQKFLSLFYTLQPHDRLRVRRVPYITIVQGALEPAVVEVGALGPDVVPDGADAARVVGAQRHAVLHGVGLEVLDVLALVRHVALDTEPGTRARVRVRAAVRAEAVAAGLGRRHEGGGGLRCRY